MAPPPATRPSIKIVSDSPYRGGRKEWSTRFHFAGNLTPTDAEFLALYTQLKGWLSGVCSSSSRMLRAVGYHPGSEVPVWEHDDVHDYSALLASDDRSCPGDCAMLVRYATDARTSKNHPIYLFNYFHDPWHTAGDRDTLSSEQHANLASTALNVLNGSWSDGTHTVNRCGPYGAVALSRFAEPLITHRDFPR